MILKLQSLWLDAVNEVVKHLHHISLSKPPLYALTRPRHSQHDVNSFRVFFLRLLRERSLFPLSLKGFLSLLLFYLLLLFSNTPSLIFFLLNFLLFFLFSLPV